MTEPFRRCGTPPLEPSEELEDKMDRSWSIGPRVFRDPASCDSQLNRTLQITQAWAEAAGSEAKKDPMGSRTVGAYFRGGRRWRGR